VILVGDEPYYVRAGFSRVPPGRLTLPRTRRPDRLLWLELVPGAFEGVAGAVMPGACGKSCTCDNGGALKRQRVRCIDRGWRRAPATPSLSAVRR